MKNAGMITSFKAAPRNEQDMAIAIGNLADAIEKTEFANGSVSNFGFYRVPNIFGHWYGFLQFVDDGLAQHAQSDEVAKAKAAVEALLCQPAETEIVEPVAPYGNGERIPGAPARPADQEAKDDVGVIYSFRVAPEDDASIEPIMRDIFAIVEREEMSTGNVLTYNLYRDPKTEGRWVMFEHFTAKGSNDHATHPDIQEPGMKQVFLAVEPFSRQLLEPFRVYGMGGE